MARRQGRAAGGHRGSAFERSRVLLAVPSDSRHLHRLRRRVPWRLPRSRPGPSPLTCRSVEFDRPVKLASRDVAARTRGERHRRGHERPEWNGSGGRRERRCGGCLAEHRRRRVDAHDLARTWGRCHRMADLGGTVERRLRCGGIRAIRHGATSGGVLAVGRRLLLGPRHDPDAGWRWRSDRDGGPPFREAGRGRYQRRRTNGSRRGLAVDGRWLDLAVALGSHLRHGKNAGGRGGRPRCRRSWRASGSNRGRGVVLRRRRELGFGVR